MRTTIDLDGPIIRELKRLQKTEGKSLGRLVSDLLATALALRKTTRTAQPVFCWTARKMAARVDLRDKEAVQAALDRDDASGASSGR